jgi:hypothetical protein
MKWWEFIKDPKHSQAIIAMLTLVIALTSIGYVFVASKQLGAMKDTLKLERPWIGPTGRKLDVMNTANSQGKQISRLAGVDWYFQNGGRSAATQTRINIVIKLGPQTPETVFMPRDQLPKNAACEKGELDSSFGNFTVIPAIPNTSFHAIFADSNIPSSIEELQARGQNLWLVGCVDYSDSSLRPWFRTNVLEYWDAKTNSFALWQTGNDAR